MIVKNFNILQQLHYIMKEWEEIRKEFRKFRLLPVNIAGKE